MISYFTLFQGTRNGFCDHDEQCGIAHLVVYDIGYERGGQRQAVEKYEILR